MKPHEQILQAIVVTAELTGAELSPAAQAVMVDDLMSYPLQSVLGALTRCRKELTGRLTLAAVLERVNADDGRPSADEAWGLVLSAIEDERESIVWTDEMAQASTAAQELLNARDKTGARMAFRAAYERLCKESREMRLPLRWSLSPGSDADRRAAAIVSAVEAGKLPSWHATALLPYQATEERHLLLTGRVMTPEERRIGQQNAKKLLSLIAMKTIGDDE